MRRFYLLLLVCVSALALPTTAVYAEGGEDEGDGEILRRSNDPNPFDANPVSYPGGPVAKAPLSTGYYVTDNDGPALFPLPSQGGLNWSPTFTFIDTTDEDAAGWRRILTGPNQVPASQWTEPGSQGLEYFRNPNRMQDSTDNAFAGPISIGFPYYYYGRTYDSFYVSTNGLVALSNRRYQYDELGNRIDYSPFRDDTRPMSGANALVDPTPDDYGFQFVALNNGTAHNSGILNPTNTTLPNTTLRSVIAPLWDDTELVQYDSSAMMVEDLGRVYWKRDASGTKLIIYVVNASMRGIKNVPFLNQTTTITRRLLRASYQVVLDRIDSTVQINYSRFSGIYNAGFQGISAQDMFGANSTIGIQSHDREYTNYLFNNQFPGGALFVNGSPSLAPRNALAIKFKQWKNIVRVLRVNFQVPSRSVPGQYVDLPTGASAANYEVLLGDPTLGVVRPIGIVQNVSDSIGPVNRTPQPIVFNVTFRIRDVVNLTAQPVNQRTESTKPLNPIRVSEAGSRDTVVFPAYITNAQIPRQLGRFRAEVIASGRNNTGLIYGEQWPFDDTTGINFFGIARLEVPYINTFNDFDVSEDGIIPSVRHWVSIGAEVVDGDGRTYSPPPPRGPATSRDGRVTLNSPVVALDRVSLEGAYYNQNFVGRVGGDTLISFPINLGRSGITQPVIILSYQRAGRLVYPRAFSDLTRLGPEHAVYNTLKNQLLQTPDQLRVEFAEPSVNGVDNITNVTNWLQSGFGDPAKIIKPAGGSPRWGVLGGGGYIDTMGNIVVDEFDSGKDFQFFRTFIPIPARWTSDIRASRSFRFRLRVAAANQQITFGPADDPDEFYVDNVYLTNLDKPEVEVTSVGADWPYTQAPASQARAIPLFAKVSNNGTTAATSFGVALSVVNLSTPPPAGQFSYYRYQTVISLGAGQDRIERFPEWNAQECGTAIPDTSSNPRPTSTTYRIFGQILPQGYDSYSANDATYEDFRLTLGPVYAFDDSSNSNDVPGLSRITGKGLNLVPPTQDNGTSPYGPTGGSLSGSFAMQFRLLTRDTIRGYQAYFGSANQSPDFITYALYKQRPGTPLTAAPDTMIRATRVNARRGEGIPSRPSDRQFNFDQYVTYLLPTPYIADPGIYFVTISQLGQTGLELGADVSRMGQVTTIVDGGPPIGVGNYSIPAHAEMRQERFWYEANAESGSWMPMITNIGNPGFPHLNFTGFIATGNTFTRGSWIPMIRPYFGAKGAGDCTVEPVELTSFEVTPLSSALRIDWATANEVNNRGFHVERRVKGADASWNDLGFTPGAGTSNRPQQYFRVDNDVVTNTTYQYRLRQEDRDGAITHSEIREGMIAGATTGAIGNRLEQNTPNPFSGATQIGFTVAQSGPVALEIYDIYGSVVRSFNANANAGQAGAIVWDGTDAQGITVPNGVYVYKLVGNGFSLSRKMTVTR